MHLLQSDCLGEGGGLYGYILQLILTDKQNVFSCEMFV